MAMNVDAIKYDGFKKANFLSEIKAKFVQKGRLKMYREFIKYACPSSDTKVLDAGVAPVKGIEGAKTLTNNFFEMLYPYKDMITATSIEDAQYIEEAYPGVKFVKTEPYKTPFCDKEFDVLFSNAVVEHTGSREQQKKFIREYCRISKKFFFTTPNRWFPIEPHSALPLVHWLPATYFRRILYKLKMYSLADENNLNLMSAKEFVELFPTDDVTLEVRKIRTLGLVSNIIICGKWDEN